jgi:carbon storage regulator
VNASTLLHGRLDMLVLSRKLGEKIVVDQRIEITLVQIEGGKVRIGVSAPPEVTILRKELADRVHQVPATSARC